MKKFKKSMISDFRLGIALTLAALFVFFFFWGHLERLEYGLYDIGARLRVKPFVAPVSVIAIDEQSIANFGRWPWPRSYIAFIIDLLESYEAKVIGLDIMYSEKDLNHGLIEVLNIINTIENNPRYSKKNISTIVLLAALKDAEKRLDNDSILSNSIAMSKKVVLPLFFNLGNPVDKSYTSLPDYLENNSLSPDFFASGSIASREMVTPITIFAEDALGFGHINIIPDKDGVARSEPLFINYKDRLFPSFALQLVLKYFDFDLKDLQLSKELKFNNKTIPIYGNNRMLIDFKSGIPYYSFYDVINKNIPPKAFKDKIVIIATSAAGLGAMHITSVAFNVPPVKIVANVIDNIISNDHILRPNWALTLELLMIFFFGLYIAIVVPQMKTSVGATISSVLLVFWLITGVYFFIVYGYWIKSIYPALLLIVGYIAIISKRYLLTERTQ